MLQVFAVMLLSLAPPSHPTLRDPAVDHYRMGYVNSAVMDAHGAVGLGSGMFRAAAGTIQPPSLVRDGGDAQIYIRDLGGGKVTVNFWMDAGASLSWFLSFKGQMQISYTDSRYGDQLITFFPVLTAKGLEWTWQSPVLSVARGSYVTASIWGSGMAVGGAYFVDILTDAAYIP